MQRSHLPQRRTLAALCALLTLSAAAGAQITEIIDESGDGMGNGLSFPGYVAVGGSGNVYVAAGNFAVSNAFEITPAGVVTEIIDETGDGMGNPLFVTGGLAADDLGNVFVSGSVSNNVFKVTAGGAITEILDAMGDGMGNTLSFPAGLALDGAGNLYVAGSGSNNVFRVTPGGVVSEFADVANTGSIAVDGAGNVYVTDGFLITGNVSKITSGGVITEIIDESGDGLGNELSLPGPLAVDAAGDVFVGGLGSSNVFRIADPCGAGTITEIIDETGDGAGNTLLGASGLAIDGGGNVYVSGTANAFQITTTGVITEIIDTTGDGAGNPLLGRAAIAADVAGNAYVTGLDSDNAFRVESAECYLVLGTSPSPGSYQGATHTWSTQVSGLIASYPVLLDDIPSFPLPTGPVAGKAQLVPIPIRELTAQILMWNPTVFPQQPEQWTRALDVTLWSDGRLTARRRGTRNGMLIRMETVTVSGRSYVRFPFSILGF